jgi:hypothetical protein
MASPTIKGTYALDPETVAALERMARRWGVSKSEALRRAIKQASAQEAAEPSPRVSALDRLQRAAGLSTRAARAWERDVIVERKASRRRGTTRK